MPAREDVLAPYTQIGQEIPDTLCETIHGLAMEVVVTGASLGFLGVGRLLGCPPMVHCLAE